MTGTMKAIVVSKFGGFDAFELRDVTVPRWSTYGEPSTMKVRILRVTSPGHATKAAALCFMKKALKRHGSPEVTAIRDISGFLPFCLFAIDTAIFGRHDHDHSLAELRLYWSHGIGRAADQPRPGDPSYSIYDLRTWLDNER